MDRRLLGIDLGITSAHQAVVLDAAGRQVARRKCRPVRVELEALEAAALAGAEPGTVLEVVMEPSAAVWLPVAVFFARRGHVVYRVPVAKAADLRRFLSRHAKSNRIDADALARLPLVDPAGLTPLELPDGDQASLDRRVRACDRLTEAIATHKVRIRNLALQLLPTFPTVITNKLGLADLAVLERYADPRALLQAGEAELTDLIHQTSRGHHGAARARAWTAAAAEALAVYGDDPAVPFADVAAEIATEVRLLRAAVAEHHAHARAREQAYEAVDPKGLTRSLPGVAAVGGPVLAAAIGRAGRFRNAAAFKAFTGLAPRANQTGDSDRKGQPASKAGPARLRDQLTASAQTARRVDPQLAAVYHQQMVERGAHHTKAICVVAARLAERLYVVCRRGEPYVLRDLDGTEVTAEQARQIIAQRYQVADTIRARRRSRTPQPRDRSRLTLARRSHPRSS